MTETTPQYLTTALTWTNVSVKLSQLEPWADNPKTSTAKNAKQLKTSKDELGQFQTVAIEPTDNADKFRVADGHQRLSAWLLAYGKDFEVKALLASRPLSETERRKVAIYSRQIGLFNFDTISGWDEPLIDWGLDTDTLADWGKQYGELAAMLGAEDEPPTEGDAEPQTNRAEELREQWGVELGQMWAIGEHRLICGDCTDRAVVDRVMGGEKAGATLTDPPYGQNQNGVPNDAPELLDAIINGAVKNIPIEDGIAVSFASPRTFPTWLDAIRANGHKFERMLWMYKAAQETFPWRGWLLKSEAILSSTLGKGDWQEVHPFSHDCYYKSEVSGELSENSGWHGSVKPLDVVTDLLKRICGIGAIVYDPFGGSGTTMVACNNLGRVCRMIELSPAYCAVILQRMIDAFPTIDIYRIEETA